MASKFWPVLIQSAIGYAFTGAIAISGTRKKRFCQTTAVIREGFLKRQGFLNKLGAVIPLPAQRKKGWTYGD